MEISRRFFLGGITALAGMAAWSNEAPGAQS